MADDNTVNITTKKQRGGITGKGFVPGVSGNPEGRPKGAGISITTEVKRKLAEIPEGQRATYLELLINRIMKQAIQDGDQQMITRIWNYVDGMPTQRNEIAGVDGEPLIILRNDDKTK